MGTYEFRPWERRNAQWDVWIDQEEYGRIADNVCLTDTARSELEQAFEHEYCTHNKDLSWDKLFEDNSHPVITCIRHLPPPEEEWRRLFWAKLIRSKIQQKGTDCYFRRLDQVINYLERHLPWVNREDDRANKLHVLYLLEMAAAGVGPDQRSFGERARRVLKDYLEKGDKEFSRFYDLWARYNIGVGYQHEGQRREAVLAHNYIIKELKPLYNNIYSKKTDFGTYVSDRHGFELLLLPSFLARAGIQLKLQLAYHSIRTIEEIFELDPIKHISEYINLNP